ncbi:Calx-beta domain-containing protein [Microvirga terricola]|uniref:Calx-beta domain-containing protein n=1 Tax=Microvirga terricola TaxID=2719797 RepID=A0ABX0VF39_9HYPH|nr:Calx-beta domain-containing protein [Microvirga terricola]NIX78086.1 hypothetical protein [Microvirga terricola]
MTTVTFQQNVGTYSGTVDTMLRESRPTKDYATATDLNVDSVDSAGKHNVALLYFANLFGSGPGQIPLGATITSATLTLQVSDKSSDGVSLHRMLTNWTDLPTWTWDSFGNGIQFDGTEASATADLITGAVGLGSQSFNVTQSLQAWAAGAANYGWAFNPAGPDGWDFNSSEGTVAPRLTVTYELPAPTAGVTVTESGGSTAVTEGGASDTFRVALASAPTANVIITITGNADIDRAPATLTFTPTNWQTPQTVTLTAVDDTLVEGTETSNVTLTVSSTDPQYNGLSIAPVPVTIFDNDAPPPVLPVVTMQNASATEGPNAQITFTLTLDTAATQDVVVSYSTLDGAATAANDFVGITSGTTTFAAGQTTATITVNLKDDTVAESTETFTLRLNSATNATIGTATATGTIFDNDSTAPPEINATVVRVHDTTQYKAGDPTGYGSGDPSGLAYVPGLNLLFIADSEHDESPYFSPTNLFAIRPDGTHVQSYSLTSFTKEPTGVAYNPKNGYLYITDDDQRKVFWVDPANPSVKVGEFSVKALGITDAEDPKFDPVTGHMYMLDGLSRTFFELTNTGQLVKSFTLPSVMTDAEALAYDSSHDVFFIASGATRGTIFEMDRDGNVLETITTLNASTYVNPITGSKPKIKGLELALSSDPNDGNRLSLYAADYGVDQKADGRLFEISLGVSWA